MAGPGRRGLRELFDDSPTPHIAHPPHTHLRDYYIATDGSFRDDGGGLGVVIETRDGNRVLRMAVPDVPPDNNVAEYRALHLGLDVLANRAPVHARIGLLVDHAGLASNVNTAVLTGRDPEGTQPRPYSLPPSVKYHWRGILARVSGFDSVRAAQIESDQNPAHPLANTPEEYRHVNHEPDRCVLPTQPSTEPEPIPPPSRADRHASD